MRGSLEPQAFSQGSYVEREGVAFLNTSHAQASHVGTSLWTHTLTCTHTSQIANQVTTGRVLESPDEEVRERGGTIIFLFSAPPPMPPVLQWALGL